jgi:hypothetical protein
MAEIDIIFDTCPKCIKIFEEYRLRSYIDTNRINNKMIKHILKNHNAGILVLKKDLVAT